MRGDKRHALDALIGWSAAVVILAVGSLIAAASGHTGGTSELTGDDLRTIGIIVGAFGLWTVGLVTITCVTIIVRLGHLTPALRRLGR
jgi:hypothetical protein